MLVVGILEGGMVARCSDAERETVAGRKEEGRWWAGTCNVAADSAVPRAVDVGADQH